MLYLTPLCRMPSESQIDEVQKQNAAVGQEVSDVQARLADARKPEDITFLRDLLMSTKKEQNLLREKENLLMQGLGNLAAWRTEIQEAVQAVLNRNSASPKSFSRVGSSHAGRVLTALEIVECVGNDLEPIITDSSTPASDSFDYTNYASESAGTPDLLKHHQTQLTSFGVKFGRNGFKVYNLHSISNPYPIVHDGQEYHGGLDGGIAPFGMSEGSAAMQLRVAFEHKQSNDQKQRYQAKHGVNAQGTSLAGALTYSGSEKGQSIIATLGAYAYNAWPLLLDLTDGEVHHMIMIRQNQLMYWDNLTPQQAYLKQSQILQSSPELVNRELQMTSISEELQQPLKKMRTLRVESGLLEQLNSVIPDLPTNEKLATSFDIIFTWAHLHPITLPPPLQKFVQEDAL